MLVPVFWLALELTIQWPALTGPTFGIPNSVHCVIDDQRCGSDVYRLRKLSGKDLSQGLQMIGPQAVCCKESILPN